LVVTVIVHSFIGETHSQNYNELVVSPHQQRTATTVMADKQPRPLGRIADDTKDISHHFDREESESSGARDENGCPGYVHDPTYVRQYPLNFTFFPTEGEGICDKLWGDGPEGAHGMRALKKIHIAPQSAPSVLCIVYTHSNRHHVLRSIVETYGQRCDGFMASSNVTDKILGAVDIPHLGVESYASMWPKVRATWQYVHDHYLDKYSWFHIGGDDMFVVAENLRNAAKEYPVNDKPVYLGGAMIRLPKVTQRMCGGGAGYTLNRAALKVLVEQHFSKPHCNPNDIRSDEDVMISDCLRPTVNCTHSADEFDETRYHPLNVNYHAQWKFPGPANWLPEQLINRHNISSPMKPLLESISATTVSFHLVRQTQYMKYNAPETVFADKGLRRYHAILFNLCGNETRSQQRRRKKRHSQ
jgi:glycoprotein-N-acetylgalactosamine 3-beta-galactosyltransferase